jgi:tight adherence protein C
MVVTLLALAWGTLAALPFVHDARRQVVVARASALAPSPARARWARRVASPRVVQVVGAVLSSPARRRARRREADALARELPIAIDLLAVAVGAGCTPYGAVEVAASWCPPPLARALTGVTQAVGHGDSFEHALRAMARANPALAPITDALGTAARLGAPIAPTLARLSAEARADLRRAAETRARTVPVKLLFPLVFLVLPAFGLLTVAPVLLDGLATR